MINYDFLEKELFAESGLWRREEHVPGPYGVVCTDLWSEIRGGYRGRNPQARVWSEPETPGTQQKGSSEPIKVFAVLQWIYPEVFQQERKTISTKKNRFLNMKELFSWM